MWLRKACWGLKSCTDSVSLPALPEGFAAEQASVSSKHMVHLWGVRPRRGIYSSVWQMERGL